MSKKIPNLPEFKELDELDELNKIDELDKDDEIVETAGVGEGDREELEYDEEEH